MEQSLSALLSQAHPILGNLSGVPLFVFVFVAALTGAFLLGYLVQGTRVGIQLGLAVRRTRSVKRGTEQVKPESVAKIFLREPLKHLWEEYSDTLHEVRKASSSAGALIEVRATVPAEVFFTREVLVDGRLFDDFTRHLPGVLTGLGIIGTFAGLLEGLSKFDATSSATAIAGLKPLLDGVAHAFSASAIAIACAMFVVFFSKLTLAVFYGLVEKLNHAIDSLYATGASEEYLSRLVHASEKSEAHAAQLKQALVEDLTKLMTNLVERQIQAQLDSHSALGHHIGESITGALAGPLKRMTDAMEASSKGNSEAVTGMLETMLIGFMDKLENTFGGQMRGIHEQMNRSMGAMTTVQHALQKLLDDVTKSNETATQRMSGTLEEAMKRAAENQELLTQQMHQFVDEFRTLVAEEQDKSKRAMHEAVDTVLENLSQALQRVEVTRQTAAAQEQTRNDGLAARTEQLVSGLSIQVEDLLKSIAEQAAATQRNVEAISNVSTRAIEGMNSGALRMESAAQRFESGGNAVSSVFERSASVSEQLSSTATVLQSAALAVQRGFEQYDSTRKTVDAHVAVLTDLIETARKEAGLSTQIITDLERIVSQLKEAAKEAAQYTQGISRELEHAFTTFHTQLINKLKDSIKETDGHLSKGVQQLNGVVQEMGVALNRLRKAA